MSKKQKQLIITVSLVLILFIALVALFNLKQKNEPQTGNPGSLSPVVEQLLDRIVATSPGPDNTKVYQGKYFTVSMPAQTWNAAEPFDCGEEELDELAMYSVSTREKNKNLPGSVINVCVGPQEQQAPQDWYNGHRQTLREQLQKQQISSLKEQQFQGQDAFVYEQLRQDFPGHYEKTIEFLKGEYIYRVTWSVQTGNAAQMEAVKQKTEGEYQTILSSLTLK